MGAGGDSGVGAVYDLVTGVGAAAEVEGVAPANETLPSSRLTTFLGAVFPLKNSAADRDGSIAGAGGNMSDWNESA